MFEIPPEAAQALLTAIILVMLADGQDSTSEHEYLRDAWRRTTGTEIDDALVARLITEARRDPEGLWARLEYQASSLAPDTRILVFKASILCLLADAEMDVGEMIALRRMASTMGIPNYRQVMSEVWRSAR